VEDNIQWLRVAQTDKHRRKVQTDRDALVSAMKKAEEDLAKADSAVVAESGLESKAVAAEPVVASEDSADDPAPEPEQTTAKLVLEAEPTAAPRLQEVDVNTLLQPTQSDGLSPR
jgi:hypothetical protein